MSCATALSYDLLVAKWNSIQPHHVRQAAAEYDQPGPCPLTFAPFLVRGLAGASAVWLADLELARLGRVDRAGVRSPQVAGDGPHEHDGKQDNR